MMSDFEVEGSVPVGPAEGSVIRLTESEWDRFTASLDRPVREPSEATKKAVEMFRQGRDEGDRRVW